MHQLRKILVPVDFSECSRVALDEAAWMAGKTGAELQLLHVWQAAAFLAPDVSLAGATPGASAFSEAVHQNARKELSGLVESLKARGIAVSSAWCEQGVPSHVIVETAKSSNADLLVMGTHGVSGLEHALLGSVVEKVLRRAPCPVLSVRAGMAGQIPRDLRRILVPVDYSEGSKVALQEAIGLGTALGAEVHVVHVWDRPHWVADTVTVQREGKQLPLGALVLENEEQELRRFLASIPEAPAAAPQARLISGEPTSAILTELDSGKHDLLVVATHGRSGFRHLLLGSVTEKLVRLAKVPVLTIPPKVRASVD